VKIKSRKQYFADYYQRNKAKMDKRTKLYYKNNPEVKLFANYEYRKKVKGVG